MSSCISLCSPHRLYRDNTYHRKWTFPTSQLPLNKKYHKSQNDRPWLACADCACSSETRLNIHGWSSIFADRYSFKVLYQHTSVWSNPPSDAQGHLTTLAGFAHQLDDLMVGCIDHTYVVTEENLVISLQSPVPIRCPTWYYVTYTNLVVNNGKLDETFKKQCQQTEWFYLFFIWGWGGGEINYFEIQHTVNKYLRCSCVLNKRHAEGNKRVYIIAHLHLFLNMCRCMHK